MTYKGILNALEGLEITGCLNDREIKTVYVGDFLSRVMSKAPEDCVWITIMNNINVAGVAVLADIPLIVFCEDVSPDSNLKLKAEEEKITLVKTSFSAFEACVALKKLMENQE